ncbi:MAG: hypothetical protein OXI03_07490 [Chloroflexota bacterium]|nr:hypothetical protein [Chloroflexota bacterium]
MAIEVKNGENLNFGTFAAAARVTHVRLRRASDDGQPVVRQLTAAVQVAANEQFQIDEGQLKVKYPSGDLTDAHMEELVEGYWGSGGSTEMEIDAMTSATAVVSVGGYAQQSTGDWDIATVSD